MTDIVERLRASLLACQEQVQQDADEIERLQAEVQRLQFQPNHRKLTRDIIRSLALEVRVLRLELKQTQVSGIHSKPMTSQGRAS